MTGNSNGLPTDDEIMRLLGEADSPMQRALISTMLKITRSLEANTEATAAIAKGFREHISEFQTHRNEFEQHVKDELALFNQGRGMQRMLAWSVTGIGVVVTIILSMGLYILNGHVSGLIHERDTNTDQEKRLVIIENTPSISRSEFEDLRNRIFQLEVMQGPIRIKIQPKDK